MVPMLPHGQFQNINAMPLTPESGRGADASLSKAVGAGSSSPLQVARRRELSQTPDLLGISAPAKGESAA